MTHYPDIAKAHAQLDDIGWHLEQRKSSLSTRSNRKKKKCRYIKDAVCTNDDSLFKGQLCKGKLNCDQYKADN